MQPRTQNTISEFQGRKIQYVGTAPKGSYVDDASGMLIVPPSAGIPFTTSRTLRLHKYGREFVLDREQNGRESTVLCMWLEPPPNTPYPVSSLLSPSQPGPGQTRAEQSFAPSSGPSSMLHRRPEILQPPLPRFGVVSNSFSQDGTTSFSSGPWGPPPSSFPQYPTASRHVHPRDYQPSYIGQSSQEHEKAVPSTFMPRQPEFSASLAYRPPTNASSYTQSEQGVAERPTYMPFSTSGGPRNFDSTEPETNPRNKRPAVDPYPADTGQAPSDFTSKKRAVSNASGDVRRTIQCQNCTEKASAEFCVIHQSKRDDGTTLAFCNHCRTLGMLPETAASKCNAGPVLKRRAKEAQRRAVVHTRNSRANKIAAEPPVDTRRRGPGDSYKSLFPASGPGTEFDVASGFEGGGLDQNSDVAPSRNAEGKLDGRCSRCIETYLTRCISVPHDPSDYRSRWAKELGNVCASCPEGADCDFGHIAKVSARQQIAEENWQRKLARERDSRRSRRTPGD